MTPFQALPPHVYLAKVKGLLTGLAPTDDELKAVVGNPGALPGLVDAWQGTPQFQERMLKFFQQAFQQTQTEIRDYVDIFEAKPYQWRDDDLVLANLEESFARTVIQLLAEGRPFTEVLTTDRFMLTPPLMMILANMDAVPRDDEGKIVRAATWPMMKWPTFKLVRTSTPTPFEETINPASPNFGVFYDPMPYPMSNVKPACKEPQVVNGPNAWPEFMELMFGARPGACGQTASKFTKEDFSAWRMVKIRKPAAGEARTAFWEVPRLKELKTTELVLNTPRVGFMTTLAFFANWPTNNSNQSRVTVNQALIVGLGRSFDDRSTAVQVSESSVDNMHIMPGTACFACHVTLDPMRDFFRQTYAVSYFEQLQPRSVPATGTFNVDGVPPVTGNGIHAFAKAMAEHPRFAPAWVQKLCAFANSQSCEETDPEFLRVAKAFKDSNHNFKVLVRELMSSPLVTYAKVSKTAETVGASMSIARRESLCAALSNRLGLPDACGLEISYKRQSTARNLAMAVPGAGYTRGEEVPLMPHDPSLFFAATTENLCHLVATMIVDVPARPRYSSTKSREALADFVHTVMAVAPSDPRSGELTAILTEHHSEALQAGAKPTEALRSAFMVACTSPLALSSGL